jgi:integrase
MAKRRGNGEGSITQRKSDRRWVARFSVATPTGPKRRRTVSIYGRTRKEVATKLAAAIAQRDCGGIVFDEGTTFGDYLDQWLLSSVKGSVKPITYESYERYVRVHIKPALGHVKLTKLTAAHLQGLYAAKLTYSLAPGTVRYMHAVIHRSLRQAHRWQLVPQNVAALTDPPKPRPEEIRPLDAAQTKRLLETARGNELEALFVIAVTAGLRRGELLGLRWSDIDLDAATMHVSRTLSRAKSGPRFTTPKNGKGRNVKLGVRAVEALKRHRATQSAARLKAGSAWQDNDLVFATSTGAPLSPDVVDRGHFKPLLSRAGLPITTRLHDLRHTCATLLLAQGMHPRLVQELLGHATVAMTLDRYSHVMPGMGEQTAAAMDAALS